MSPIRCNKGTSLVEVMVAILLTSVAIMSVMSMQPLAWSTAGKTDHLGRAAGILASELESREFAIMVAPDPSSLVGAGSPTTVYASGFSSAVGTADFPYTVQTTVGQIDTKSWWVTVRVTWTGNATGITGGMVVTSQDDFRS